MLTASQVEIVAFTTEDGTIFHYDCAIREYSTIAVEKAEAGFTDTGLTPLIQFSLDEWVGEESYEYARERAYDFADNHPRLAELFGVAHGSGSWVEPESGGYGRWVFPDEARNYDRLVDRLAEKYTTGPTCDHCGGYVHEAPLAKRDW